MFLALYAYEDAHRKLCSATMSDPKPAGDLSGNFGVFVKYFGGYHGGVFEANYDSNTRGYFYHRLTHFAWPNLMKTRLLERMR